MDFSIDASEVLLWFNVLTIIVITLGFIFYGYRQYSHVGRLTRSNEALGRSVGELVDVLNCLIIDQNKDIKKPDFKID